jgi:uncharacterized protein (DUF433 family)
MTQPNGQPTSPEPTPAELQRLQMLRRSIADELPDLIENDPAVMMGKPVVRGTRISVELILRKLATGETMEQILESHPRLTGVDIRAALAYAAEAMAHETVRAAGK